MKGVTQLAISTIHAEILWFARDKITEKTLAQILTVF